MGRMRRRRSQLEAWTRCLTAPLLAPLTVWALACTTPYELGTTLYREGDIRGALETWRSIPAQDGDHGAAQTQISVVEAEFRRMLTRYEKRGLYYEGEGRLAEALLSYRLALKLDPEQPKLLGRVQELVRTLDTEQRQTLERMRASLEAGKLQAAGQDAQRLERLNPFSPGVQVEIRQVRAALGEEVLRFLEAGKASYPEAPRRAQRRFEQVLALDPGNETALGYLSYIQERAQPRAEKADAEPETAAALTPPMVSQAEILAEGHYRSATQAEAGGDAYRALQQYEEALRRNPSHPRAGVASSDLRKRLRPQIEELETRAKRYFQEEDLQNAVLMWKRVLLIEPQRESAAYNLARAERMLARLEELQANDGGS